MVNQANPGGGGVPTAVLADAGAATALFLRLAGDGPGGEEAALLARLAAVAIGVAEAFLDVALIARPFEDVVAADGRWRRLATGPVRAIAGVTALSPDAAPAVLPVTRYRIDIDAGGDGRVRVDAGGTGGAPLAAVSYCAGVAVDWAGVPPPVAQGVVATAARLFVDRAAAATPAPDAIALWRPFRRLRLRPRSRPAGEGC